MTTMSMANTKTTKPRSRPRKKRKSTKPLGARAMLLTLALGGTLGGWAGLAYSAQQKQPITAEAPTPIPTPETILLVDQAATNVEVLQLPPIPTVVPPPSSNSNITVNAISTAPSTVALAPIPAVPQPVIQAPVTRTRSSR